MLPWHGDSEARAERAGSAARPARRRHPHARRAAPNPQELGTRRFLSAPVCNAAGGCIGLVDKLDMVRCARTLPRPPLLLTPAVATQVSFVLSQLREDEGLVFQLNALASDAGRLARASVGDIVNFSGRNAFHPVSRRATLGEVVGMLSRRARSLVGTVLLQPLTPSHPATRAASAAMRAASAAAPVQASARACWWWTRLACRTAW